MTEPNWDELLHGEELPPVRRPVDNVVSELLNDIQCPGCDMRESDYTRQREHMETCHPEIIAARIKTFRRWDGWVND